MSSTTYSKWQLMWPVMRRAFFLQNDKITAQSPMARLFTRSKSSSDHEEFDGVGGLGLMDEYKGAIEYGVFGKYPKTTIDFPEYAKGISIPRKLIDDDKSGAIQRQFSELARVAGRTQDHHAGSVFNNAFSSAADYLGADGKALCATDHPLSSENATAQSNKGTTALSHSAVVNTIEAMQAFTDDTNELLGCDPNVLLVPRTLAEEAFVITQSLNKSGTADNDKNYLQSRPIQVIVWHRLTDTNNWFMLDTEMQHLHWIDHTPAELEYSADNKFDLQVRARVYARWGYGWDYPFFIYGHEVT